MRRRAIILPIVLIVIGLLAMTMAGFIFFVRAEVAGTTAQLDLQQARLAAESGLQEVTLVLREEQHNPRAWYHAPQRFRHGLIHSPHYEREEDPVARAGTREAVEDEFGSMVEAWRFSIVADAYQDPAGTEDPRMRFGLTPESSKLHLNAADERQIRRLLTPLLLELELENADELINALLDWRDADSEMREGGAENDHYNTLEPAYNAKNGPLDSIEELLLVKGFSAAVLYGEDVNRNGILDPNEDDGDESFPLYDNQDGTLNRGIAPFLTVWSREPDTALDNKPRINLNQDSATITALVEANIPEEERTIVQPAIDFILQLKGDNFDFSQLGSVAELYRVGYEQEADEFAEGEEDAGEGEGGGAGEGADLGALDASPVTLEQLPILLDRFSVRTQQEAQQGLVGLININTAPARVLRIIPGMPPGTVGELLVVRDQLEAEAARTPTWLLTQELVSTNAFHEMAPHITTKAVQFHVEVLGYADHLRISRRFEWIVEMIGPLVQIRYFRDLSPLGFAWPLDDEEIAGEGVELETDF